MGWAATCFHSTRELSSLGLGSSSSPPLCRLLHAYQAVEHSSHSRIEMHSLVLVRAVSVKEGREHPRNQVLVVFLSARPRKITTPRLTLKTPPLAF